MTYISIDIKRLILISIGFFCLNVNAEITEDFDKLIKERNRVEKVEKELTEKRIDLDRQVLETAKAWGKCAGGRWSVVWQPFEENLEKARLKLETSRQDLYKIKESIANTDVDLDLKRRQIEKKFKRNRKQDYQNEMYILMKNIQTKYLFPLEEKYIPSLESYLTAVEILNASASDAVSACRKNELGSVAVTAGVKHIGRAIEIIEKLALVTSKILRKL